MNRETHRCIERLKKKHRNIYGISNFKFRMAACFLIALWVVAVADVACSGMKPFMRTVLYTGIAGICFAAVFFSQREKKGSMVPYTRQEGFQFLGLHDLRNADLKDSSDVLQRTEEIACMKKVLEEIIFPQSVVKQALCLVGPSGCGKSTILAFFREKYKSEYLCYDFSGNYHELESKMCEDFGTNIDVALADRAAKQKIVIILDQFERYFHLSPEEQENVRRIMRTLCRRNTAIILSLREEFLADFLKQFDMNDIKADPQTNIKVQSHGIFHELTSIIWRNTGTQGGNGFLKPVQTLKWAESIIKNNGKVYLNSPFSHMTVDLSEQMGITLFYCQNENQVPVQADGQQGSSSLLLNKCLKVFGANGESYFSKYKNATLIEQQIVFHMAEFNQKMYAQTPEELETMFRQSNSELLNDYFDVQLASCKDYWLASKILYIYSKARDEQIFIKTDDVEKGLFSQQFSQDGYKTFLDTIAQLEKLQLIRKNNDGSSQEYEIAHDFIAQAYLKYCENSMNRDIKNALDLFLSEYMNAQLKDEMKKSYTHRLQMMQAGFYRSATALAIAVMCIGFIIEAFVWNPWTTVLQSANPYGDYLPLFPLVITSVSVIYLCGLYDRMVKYFRGRSIQKCKCCYTLLMVLAVLAVLAYPHFLLLDSIDLIVSSVDIFFLLNAEYLSSCREQLRAYGIRSIMIGTIFAIGHIVFWATNATFDTYLIFVETVMFSVLTAYACLSHLTEEYLYPRMIDASSEKK